MRVLVAIASYGHTNDQYLERVLAEYRAMSYEIHIVVLSNITKEVGPDVELRVGLPAKNPFTLPFAHKKVLVEGLSGYDLFIYSEDDILITPRNIEAFLKATPLLPPDELAGFVHAEADTEGKLYFDPLHSHFHWDLNSVVSRGSLTFARYTNDHSACFMLTQSQLAKALQSGGFLVAPHEGRYEVRETAATDPYTQCGFKKMICVSNVEAFTVRHLPANKYSTRPFRESTEFHQQIRTLLKVSGNGLPKTMLFEPETKVLHAKWSKDYYELCDPRMVSRIPSVAKTVLSLGCGWGDTEAFLAQKGMRVVGVPMDAVIAASAHARGIEIVYGDFAAARTELANRRFDCLLVSNVLHLVPDPGGVLSSFSDLLSEDGVVLLRTPNFGRVMTGLRRLQGKPQYKHLTSFETTGLHAVTPGVLKQWLGRSHLKLKSVFHITPPRAEWLRRLTGGALAPILSEEFIAVAGRS